MEREDVWRPWDADDVEYADRLTVREMLPEHVRPAVQTWLNNRLSNAGYGHTSAELRHFIETALQAKFPFEHGEVLAKRLVEEVLSRGDQFTVRVIDLLIANMSRDQFYNMPAPVTELSDYLDLAASSIAIIDDERSFRIGRRLPAGVEIIASAAAQGAGEVAGRHLSKAWTAATSIRPDESTAMTEAIRAVEEAAGALVTPKDKQKRLGKIVVALKQGPAWSLAFEGRDDGHPDHRMILIGMLETLAFAQRDRHGGSAPSTTAALGHVQLASTLVSWFSTGVVVVRDSSAG